MKCLLVHNDVRCQTFLVDLLYFSRVVVCGRSFAMVHSNESRPVLNVEIFNGYILISCAQYDYRIASANVSDLKNKSIKEVSESIGYSVLQAFSNLQQKREGQAIPYAHGKLVTVGEAAKLLRKSCSSIRRMVAHGELQAKVTHGGHRRVYIKSINAYEQ
jgi:excisionase family DNA binding protein